MNCRSCGTEIAAGARFCRLCGSPVQAWNSPSVLEAETQTLGSINPNITGRFDANPTGAAYLSPQQMHAEPLRPPTGNIHTSHTGRNLFAGTFGAILLIIALVAVGKLLLLKSLSISHSALKGIPTAPGVPKAPTIPIAPPAPPAPPLPGQTTGGGAAADTSLIYPGAETVVQTSRGSRGGTIQLRTKDSFDKVFDWYVAKMKPTKVVKSPSSNAVLKSDGAVAIITAGDDETQIIVKGKLNEDDSF